MNKNGGASIVLVSGSPAKKCKPGYVALSCVGAAVENLVRALATELSPLNIRINGVSPGMFDRMEFDVQRVKYKKGNTLTFLEWLIQSRINRYTHV